MGGTANETRRDGRDSGRRGAAGLLLLLLAAGLSAGSLCPGPDLPDGGHAQPWLAAHLPHLRRLPMVYVPAGCFVAGRIDGPSEEHARPAGYAWAGSGSARPRSPMPVRGCVEAEACTPPVNPVYFAAPRYADHPVVHITWDQAAAYAAWRGGALPSEFQWSTPRVGRRAQSTPGAMPSRTAAGQLRDGRPGHGRRGAGSADDGASWVGRSTWRATSRSGRRAGTASGCTSSSRTGRSIRPGQRRAAARAARRGLGGSGRSAPRTVRARTRLSRTATRAASGSF